MAFFCPCAFLCRSCLLTLIPFSKCTHRKSLVQLLTSIPPLTMEGGWEGWQGEVLDLMDIICLNKFSFILSVVLLLEIMCLGPIESIVHKPKNKPVLGDLNTKTELWRDTCAFLSGCKIFVIYWLHPSVKASLWPSLESTLLRSQFITGMGTSPLYLFPEQSLHLPGKRVRAARGLWGQVVNSVSQCRENEDNVSTGWWDQKLLWPVYPWIAGQLLQRGVCCCTFAFVGAPC